MTVTTPAFLDVPQAAAPAPTPASAGKRTDATFAQDVLAASWAYGWLVALVVAIAIGLGVVWIIQSPTRYTSRLIVMPRRRRRSAAITTAWGRNSSKRWKFPCWPGVTSMRETEPALRTRPL